MITLKKMRWSHAFSYGEGNEIDFSANSLLQLIGKNGHGKSSIALILEEVLFNKNSKGIKKADILNRHSKSTKYWIELEFSKDADQYVIKTIRGSTQTVVLIKNGEDISSHTATGTYKMVEEILGFDHKTFTQIVYQSSAFSLEFLTATDTNRKKFLIDLLSLGIYTRASEVFKSLNKAVSDEAGTAQLKVNTINDWLIKFSKEDLNERESLDIPASPVEFVNKNTELEETLKNILTTNKKIAQNNKYKEILEDIDLTPAPAPSMNLEELRAALVKAKDKVTATKKQITVVQTVCNACGQPIEASAKLLMVAAAKEALPNLEAEVTEIQRLVNKVTAEKTLHEQSIKNSQEWERYHSLINPGLDTVPLDQGKLEQEQKEIQKAIATVNEHILRMQRHNNDVSAHNAKVKVLKTQLETMHRDLEKFTTAHTTLQDRLANIQILVKTFSTTGLVAYKIECLVKDLESLTNEYLVDMSDGRFQLSFKVNSSDKLIVVINDNGQDIDILALSNGERSRVNIATLLAIRKLMQTLSDSRINLLILDETIESLDADGKEKLIEILLKEESLNTVLVSHGFSHPLLEKVSIVKENNISRIE